MAVTNRIISTEAPIFDDDDVPCIRVIYSNVEDPSALKVILAPMSEVTTGVELVDFLRGATGDDFL